MTIEGSKQRFLDLEKRLSRHISAEREQALEQVVHSPRDAADDRVADEDESVDFAVAELDQPTRLEAVPWTPYRVKYQSALATEPATRAPSL